jgi:hypothetical protein
MAGAWRQAACCALACGALALPSAARAQFVGTLGLDSVNRYRGSGTDDVGPVLRASAMADATSGPLAGAYGGVAGLWRTLDAGLASADAIVGWSGRLSDLPALAALAPAWGWDAAVHRTHYGDGSRHDFSEAMAGLLAPDWTLRTWFAPRYFGASTHTLYTELDANHALDEHWHVFGHAGWLHYGAAPRDQSRIPDRADTLVGIGGSWSRWDVRLARDGVVAGHARSDIDARRRRAAWILSAAVAF